MKLYIDFRENAVKIMQMYNYLSTNKDIKQFLKKSECTLSTNCNKKQYTF